MAYKNRLIESQMKDALNMAQWIDASPHEWPTADKIPHLCHALMDLYQHLCEEREKLAAAREREAGLAALIERLRERLIDSDKRLCNHHEHFFVVQQAKNGLGSICPICAEEPNVFVRNTEVLSLTPPAALDDLRRREREAALREAADVIEAKASGEQMTGAFAAKYLRDRADAIAAERKEGE